MRIAVAYRQNRVSPVFDVAERMLLVDIDKGPVSAIRSIASSLEDRQPVAIYDVTDDPRIQYPEAAVKG